MIIYISLFAIFGILSLIGFIVNKEIKVMKND